MDNRISLRKRMALEVAGRIYRRLRIEHPLRQLFWECTLRCNLHCRHCGSDCRKEAGIADMPLSDFLNVLDAIASVQNPNKVFVIVTGGEPLVRPDIVTCGEEIYRRGFPWGMVSNGLALTPMLLEQLLDVGIHSMTISLDGMESHHNWMRGHPHSFQRAIDAIRLLAHSDIPAYDVVTCVTPHNLGILADLRNLLIDNGVKNWRLFTVFPVGRAADNAQLQLSGWQFRQMLEFIRETRRQDAIKISYGCEGFLGEYEGEVRDHFFFCRAGVTVGSVLVDGSISACPSIRANFRQGNIYRDDFMKVWEERFELFRDRRWAKTGQCADCSFFRYCQGNGMHLHDEERKLLVCHYDRLREV